MSVFTVMVAMLSRQLPETLLDALVVNGLDHQPRNARLSQLADQRKDGGERHNSHGLEPTSPIIVQFFLRCETASHNE
jgi:hypothetical protein